MGDEMSAFVSIYTPGDWGDTCRFYNVKGGAGEPKKKKHQLLLLSSDKEKVEERGTDDFPTPESPTRRT